MLKIVSGIYGGRAIEAPAGDKTRPTTNRAREAVFSALTSAVGGFDDLKVVDLFAGSGALGLEALSRGASHCTFVENNRRAFNVVKQNLESLKVDSDSFDLIFGDALKLDFNCDLVLLDPPYKFAPEVVEKCTFGAPFVYYEHSALSNNFECFSGYEVVYDKTFGEVHSTIMKNASYGII